MPTFVPFMDHYVDDKMKEDGMSSSGGNILHQKILSADW